MHSDIHLAVAHESARNRLEGAGEHRASRRSPSGLRARLFSRARAAAAPSLPSRAAPGMDA
jgi:hypothetical protein